MGTRSGLAYEAIGSGYASLRRAEPTWEQAVRQALAGAVSVVNIGAGSGSYEPADQSVVAVEPSTVMIDQRPPGSAPSLRAVAEHLPFGPRSFDAALAVLTVHHWTDPVAGLEEMRRVARRQVVVTWDPTLFAENFWFARDYLAEALERETTLATLRITTQVLGPDSRVLVLPVPAHCQDGFFAAYWRRPEAYLDPAVRAAISGIALLPDVVVKRAVAKLANDLESGRWQATYTDLLARESLDVGYRMVVHDAKAT